MPAGVTGVDGIQRPTSAECWIEVQHFAEVRHSAAAIQDSEDGQQICWQ
jgi:hypothetical protein